MRSNFTSTFRPARFRQVPLAGARRRPQIVLGLSVFADERNAILRKIQTGKERMAQVRKWIASRIDEDPMLLRTFGQEHISKNFWDFDDIVVKDQYYVDLAEGVLREELESWELDEETLARVDEWALVIDNMYAGMQEFGKVALTTVTGQPIPGTVAPPGKSPVGASVTAGLPSKGITTKDALTYGGIGLGAIALILLLKGA